MRRLLLLLALGVLSMVLLVLSPQSADARRTARFAPPTSGPVGARVTPEPTPDRPPPEVEVRAHLVRLDTPDVVLELDTHDGLPFVGDLVVWWARPGVAKWRDVPAQQVGGRYYLDLPPGQVRMFLRPRHCLGVLDVKAEFEVSLRKHTNITLRLPPAGRIVVRAKTHSLLLEAHRHHATPIKTERDPVQTTFDRAVRSAEWNSFQRMELDSSRDTVVHVAPGWWWLRLTSSHAKPERVFEVLPGVEYVLR